MTGTRCVRCGQYWAVSTRNLDAFEVISRVCPDCIPAVLPRCGFGTAS